MGKIGVLLVGVSGLVASGGVWAQPAAQPLSSSQARYHAMSWGCTNVSRLSAAPSGNWSGQCEKGGKTVSIMIDRAGTVSQSTAPSLTSADARADLMKSGCNNISTLTPGSDGSWHGRCDKGGKTVDVTVSAQGKISIQQI